MDLYEAHKKDRHKFEILAFHDGTVKDFKELDRNTKGPREKFWGGRDLPFPILLDATGQTIKDWGVRAFPTTLLIDPEGKLVGEAQEKDLEEKLPPLSMSIRVTQGLNCTVSLSLEDPRLDHACELLRIRARIPIRLDMESLKVVGISFDTPVPLTMAGSLSLRSWLNVLLEADGLAYEQDDKGLVIRARKPGTLMEPPSERQRAAVKRIEKALDQKVSFDFKDKSLEEVVRFFDTHTQDETVILSPRDRKAGALNPKMLVSGSAKDIPLRKALTKLLGPLGVSYTIRDEVIVLTANPKTSLGK